ncbi:hypothetical protein [Allomuricauda sp. NBRC 101325]|uniref:hypothetical protein n=1 Tax=Allomuricauda sp. NBRC 101325 TaxID=1113758 RepID=UPI0024A3AE4D|nr:hypothetical protein [Muricauda sp. NBRC 101325]GLU44020.1 hypothetical protein Musp01_16440 [Muricauda sp. NBRC 101325]
MSEFFKAELKDRFLDYALSRTDYFEIQTLYDEYLRPNYSLEFVIKLVQDILDYDPSLLDVMSGNGLDLFLLASTPSTEDFLNEGGFMHLYVKEEEKWDVFLDQLSSTRKLSKEDKKQIRRDAPDLKREKTMLFGLVAAVAISFLFTVFSMINGAFLQPEYVPADEFERKLEYLKEQYIMENERLRQELNSMKQASDTLNL